MIYDRVSLPIIEARVDWISCSARTGEAAQRLRSYAAWRVSDETLEGNIPETFSSHGFKGVRAGKWAWALGTAGCIVQASQDGAMAAANDLARLADHWSRVDYCVTARDDRGSLNPTSGYWRAWATDPQVQRRGSKQGRTEEHWGGSTITQGSRSSAYYARCYNKSLESPGRYPPGCWRWEVEMKSYASEAEHETWKAGGRSDEDVKRVVSSAWTHFGLGVPFKAVGSVGRWKAQTRTADADLRLEWLASQVKPSIAWLVRSRGADAVVRAIGLMDALELQ